MHDHYANGDEYIGEVKVVRGGSVVKHGLGVYRFSRGSCYEGEWCDGVMQGWGRFVEADVGDVFEGHWRAGKRFFGRYCFANGDIYEGGFVDNLKHGRAVVWEGHEMYEVEFHRDELVSKVPFATQEPRKKSRRRAPNARPLPKPEKVSAALRVLKQRNAGGPSNTDGLVFESEDVLRAKFRFH